LILILIFVFRHTFVIYLLQFTYQPRFPELHQTPLERC
jgi:hypothetical protein